MEVPSAVLHAVTMSSSHADALSCPNQVIGAEWTLHQEVLDMLRKCWPVMIDLFVSSLNHRSGVYFAPVSDLMAAGTVAMLQPWDFLRLVLFHRLP